MTLSHTCVAPAVLILTSILAMSSGLKAQEMKSPNLVPNPDFETVEAEGRAASWSQPLSVYSLSGETPRTGKRCLKYENTDAGRYVLCTAPLDLKHGKRYAFEVWVRTEDVKGEDSGATICVEWYGEGGKFLGGSYPKGVKGTQPEWTRVSGTTGPVPDTAVKTHVVCYVRKGMTGTAWFDDVAVRRYYPPLLEGITTDVYRSVIDGGDVVVHAGLNLDGHDVTLSTLDARIFVQNSVGNTVATAVKTALTADEVTGVVDAGALLPGSYRVVCEVRSADGAASGRVECALRRVAVMPERKAYIDAHGRLILDNKPFFPLGTYWSGVKKEHLEIYGKSAFNCIMPYGSLNREQLDLCHAHGVKVIYSVKDYYAGTRWSPGHIKTEADERPALEAKVREVGDHPAIMAWYINDELPISMIDRLTAHRDWMEELDPGRPTWVVLYQVGQVRSYLTTFDVIGTDPYPIPSKPVGEALRYTRLTRDAGFGRRAVWMVPQIFNWASYKKTPEEKAKFRAPTLEEMRSMAWQCICGGANGLVFYSWSDLWRMNADTTSGGRALVREPFEERWADVAAMGQEIARFIPVLLSVEAAPEPRTVTAPDALAWRIHSRDGKAYLFVVNSSDQPVSATFAFGVDVAGLETVVGTSGATAAGPEVKLSFAPLEPKVLVFRHGP